VFARLVHRLNLRASLRRRRLRRADRRPMHVCVACGSGLVNPMRWHQWGDDCWLAVLRCGECGHERAGLFPADLCGYYQYRLDAEAKAVRESLEALRDEREREELEQLATDFIAALHADDVRPEDFARRRAA
jgi:hypothetical protein